MARDASLLARYILEKSTPQRTDAASNFFRSVTSYGSRMGHLSVGTFYHKSTHISSRENGLDHLKMNSTWTPPRPSQDVNETGSVNLCQFKGRHALPPKVAFIHPPNNGSKTAEKHR